jgi:hypothetical protein
MKKILLLTFSFAVSQLIFSQNVIDARYKLLSGKYIIGTDYYTKKLTITHMSKNMFSYRMSTDVANGCDFNGQFDIVDNKGISTNKLCGEIVFDFSKIINWIKTKKGDSRYFPIIVSVANDKEDCIKCSMPSGGFDFDPWGKYWRVGN